MGGNDMNPRIVTVQEMRLVGIGERMSRADDRTVRLWQTLMPLRTQIEGRIPDRYISMRVNSRAGMSIEEMIAPETEFEKWAAVQVTEYGTIPERLQPYVLAGGRYAVFVHRGPARTFPDTMRYIFAVWLPESGYALDDREQFEVLPENWRPDDEDAEEEIYLPIRGRSDP